MQHFVQQFAESDGQKLFLYMFSATVVMHCQVQPQHPQEQLSQNIRGLDSHRAPKGGYRWTAGTWLQATCSSWPCYEGEWIRWSPEVPHVSKKWLPLQYLNYTLFQKFLQSWAKDKWGIQEKPETSTQFFSHQFWYNKQIPTESKTFHLLQPSHILGSNIKHFLYQLQITLK